MTSKNTIFFKSVISIMLVVLFLAIYLQQYIISLLIITFLLILDIINNFKNSDILSLIGENKNKRSAQKYLDAFENSGIYAKLDSKKTIIHANRQFCQIMYITKEKAIGLNLSDFIKTNAQEIDETIKCKLTWEGTKIFVSHNLNETYLNCSFIPILDEDKQLIEVLFLATDITELTFSKTSIKKNLYIDSITKLPNRLKLFTDKKLLETRKKATYILYNIDSFDSINSMYGNNFGDNILASIAKWIRKNLINEHCALYKFEADIYVSVSYEDINEDDLKKYLTSFSQKVEEEEFSVGDTTINITMTIGAAQSKANQLKLSQIAYKEAKKQKKAYTIYDRQSNKEEIYRKNIEISKIIKGALKNNNVIPYFQPILNIETNTIEKYESLMRIKKNDGLILPPLEFLGIAKKMKTYSQLSCIMIQKSIKTFEIHHEEFSVNLSALDITNKNTTKFILDLLDKTGVGPWIIFEILESEGIENYTEILSFTEQVKSYGAKIAIDDFGSGYSNFERLVKLQIDFIKIDGSLIKNIDQNDDMEVITRTIVNFAKELGIKTIAEYVHSESVLTVVKKLGVDYAQGYYIGKPSPELLY